MFCHLVKQDPNSGDCYFVERPPLTSISEAKRIAKALSVLDTNYDFFFIVADDERRIDEFADTFFIGNYPQSPHKYRNGESRW